MKRIIKLSLILFLAKAGAAQQLPTSSFYDLHPIMHNPATAGAKKHAEIGGMFRTQWSGIDGGPQTALLFGNTLVAKGKVGIGGYLYNDVTGPTRRTGLQMAYSYHIPMQNGGTFSLGIEGRVQQWSFDRSKLQESLGANDPAIAGDDKKIKGDAGFGISYNHPKFQIGASVSQLIQTKLNFYTGTGTVNEEAMLYRHFFFHGYYDFDVDGSVHLIPNALVIAIPHTPTEVQAGLRLDYNKTFWFGLGYHLNQSWMASAGVHLWKNMNLGYAFDVYKTPLSIYDKGANAHEIMLRYEFIK